MNGLKGLLLNHFPMLLSHWRGREEWAPQFYSQTVFNIPLCFDHQVC
jgi:hypothetical protein